MLSQNFYNSCQTDQQNSHRGCRKRSVVHRQHTIRPLVRDWVELAVQLAHGDGLGVQHNYLHLVLIHQFLEEEGRKQAKVIHENTTDS